MSGILYFDGGATPNPGIGKCGYVLLNGTQRTYNTFQLGDNVTNNEAEYMGLIYGLEAIMHYGIKNVTVYGDSQLVLNHMNGYWKVNAVNLKTIYDYANELSEQIKRIEYIWVKRDLNYAGILLEHGPERMKQTVDRN